MFEKPPLVIDDRPTLIYVYRESSFQNGTSTTTLYRTVFGNFYHSLTGMAAVRNLIDTNSKAPSHVSITAQEAKEWLEKHAPHKLHLLNLPSNSSFDFTGMELKFKPGDRLTDPALEKDPSARHLNGHHATVLSRVFDLETLKLCYHYQSFYYAFNAYGSDTFLETCAAVDEKFRLLTT